MVMAPHTESVQGAPWQSCPHAPQFFGSSAGLVHEPSQQSRGLVQPSQMTPPELLELVLVVPPPAPPWPLVVPTPPWPLVVPTPPPPWPLVVLACPSVPSIVTLPLHPCTTPRAGRTEARSHARCFIFMWSRSYAKAVAVSALIARSLSPLRTGRQLASPSQAYYPTANMPFELPPLSAWLFGPAQAACVESFTINGGYGEMSVVGESDECDHVDKVFNHVIYCPLSCNDPNPPPECANCQPGGGGNF
jgi:hypothetical protein